MSDRAHATDDGLIAARLRDIGSPRSLPARSWLYHEGDPSNSVLIVESGLLRVDRTTRNGHVVLLDLLAAGRLVGELGAIDDTPRSAAISSVTDASLTYVSAADFRQLLDTDPAFQNAVLGRVVRRLRALSNQFVETSSMDAPGRVAGRLVRLVEIDRVLATQAGQISYPDEVIDLRLPINQAELGQWSGLSREGTVKGLATLRSLGLIETGRKRVLINSYPDLVARVNDA